MTDNKNSDDLALEKKVIEILNHNIQSAANEKIEAEDQIDLGEVWLRLWSQKWMIIAISSVFAIASIFYALSLSDEYKSTAVLFPASASSTSSLSKLAGKFGGLASLAGVKLGGGDDDKTLIGMELIKTWGFLEDFIIKHDLKVAIYAAKGWNRATNKIIIDEDIYDVVNKKWVRDFDASVGQKAEPSSWELFEVFSESISVSQDKQTGLISISVIYYSPTLAKAWVDKLVIAINTYMKNKDNNEAKKSIIYLEKQIKMTNKSEMQSIFYQLIEEQTKTLMLSEVNDEYVFKTISSSKVAEIKARPKRAFIVVLGTLFGGFFACFVVIVMTRKKRIEKI